MQYPWLPYLLADLVAVTFSYYITLLIRFESAWGRRLYDRLALVLVEQPAGVVPISLETFYYTSAFRIVVIVAAVVCFLYACLYLYDIRRFLLPRPVFWHVFLANVIALTLFYAYWYLMRNVYHPRSMFATMIALNCILCPILRGGVNRGLRWTRARKGLDRIRMLACGAGAEYEMLVDWVQTIAPHGFQVSQTLPLQGGDAFDVKEIAQALERDAVDVLLLAQPDLQMRQIMEVLSLANEKGVPVKVLSRELDILLTEAHLPSDLVRGIPLVHFAQPSRQARLGPVRHAVTLLVAALALVALLPVLVLVALAIRLTSPGKVLFRQRRIGLHRHPFWMYKFRTMRNAAEEEQSEVEAINEVGGPLFKIKQDPRITTVGRFLRRFSLDELPQLANVLKGEMAIVGPRPLPERDYALYEEDWHFARHDGLPGLTGLWQVSGRSDLDFHQMCILDVYYLWNHSWMLDLKIVLQTCKTVVFGVGAY